MKRIVIAFFGLLVLMQSCNGQKIKTSIKKVDTSSKKNKVMERFDIENFNKNQVEGEWKFKNSSGTSIRQYKIDDGYQEEAALPGSYFILSKSYYENGNLAEVGQRFHEQGFLKGIWTSYDENGIVISEVNHDLPFKYSWEDVLRILKTKGINPSDNFTLINRKNDTLGPQWFISWDTKELAPDGKKILKNVTIDGITGKVSKEETVHYDY